MQQERGVGGARFLPPRLAILFADCAILFAGCADRGGQDKQGGSSEEAAPPQHDVDAAVNERGLSQYLNIDRSRVELCGRSLVVQVQRGAKQVLQTIASSHGAAMTTT